MKHTLTILLTFCLCFGTTSAERKLLTPQESAKAIKKGIRARAKELGIEQQNVTGLELNEKGITDLKALQGLIKLKTLWLDKNHIENKHLAPVAQLERLENLHLNTQKHLSNIRELENLKQLRTLELNDNNLFDLSPWRD